MITKDLGAVTAYAYAVEGGYTGTEEEFTQLMADLGITVDEFEHFSVSVSTLPAGSSATASYSDGVLSLGIPKGDKGDTGNTGATGATPQLSIGTVETTAQPSVTITGTAENPVLNFGLVKGDKGDTGEVSEAELTQAFEDFSANGTVANAEQLTTDIRANDQTPYLFRTSGGSVDIGDREYINGIVGVSVPFNQLYNPANTQIGTISGVTISKSGGVISASGTATANVYHRLSLIPDTSGHKMLFYFTDRAIENVTIYDDKSTRQFNNISTAVIINASGVEIDYKFRIISGATVNFAVTPQVFDLTQMFGSTIADYIYSLEQANAGAGVAFFKSLFPKPYYAYNSGELMSVKGLVSHDMVGFNAWDEEWEVGAYNGNNGEKVTQSGRIRSKNFIPVIPNTRYYAKGSLLSIYFYDASEQFIDYTNVTNGTFVTRPQAAYITFNTYIDYGNTYKNDICFNLSWDGSEDGNYEPYQKWSYPLDSDLELRGIPKISNGNLYYDGDVYEADGTVTRKYGIVDLGSFADSQYNYYEYQGGIDGFTITGIMDNAKRATSATDVANIVAVGFDNVADNTFNLDEKNKEICLNTLGIVKVKYDGITTVSAFKTAMSGIYLVYELATPTTETADPYTSPQIVNDFGTEEFVISNTVDVPIPVGHNTDYPVDLKAKLEMAPNSPSQGNGDYIVRQTNGTNEYVPLVIEEVLPQTPSSNGTYSLTLTVANGEATLSWT